MKATKVIGIFKLAPLEIAIIGAGLIAVIIYLIVSIKNRNKPKKKKGKQQNDIVDHE